MTACRWHRQSLHHKKSHQGQLQNGHNIRWQQQDSNMHILYLGVLQNLAVAMKARVMTWWQYMHHKKSLQPQFKGE